MVSACDGRHYFHDVNALSNFVGRRPNVIGFNPEANLVDLIDACARRAVEGVTAACRRVLPSRVTLLEGRLTLVKIGI